jgi:hypothetical protein
MLLAQIRSTPNIHSDWSLRIYILPFSKIESLFRRWPISGPEFVRQEKTSPPAHPQLFHGMSYDRIRRFSQFANYNFL